MSQHIDSASDTRPANHTPTTVFEGYIGEMNDEKVIIFPHLDRRYCIELRRRDVLDFEAGLGSGACKFVVSSDAPVQERITVMTTTRRNRTAADVSGSTDPMETEISAPRRWLAEADWQRPA